MQHAAVKPEPADFVLGRTCAMDGSHGTGLYAILAHLRREQLIIMGISTTLAVEGIVRASLNRGYEMFVVEVALGCVAGYVSIKILPQTATGKKMFLHHTQEGQRAQTPLADDLIGQRGITQTLLRPSGMAMIDGKRLDVMAESGMIAAGSIIRVVSVNGTQIVVRGV